MCFQDDENVTKESNADNEGMGFRLPTTVEDSFPNHNLGRV
jgi:hypothetical protein